MLPVLASAAQLLQRQPQLALVACVQSQLQPLPHLQPPPCPRAVFPPPSLSPVRCLSVYKTVVHLPLDLFLRSQTTLFEYMREKRQKKSEPECLPTFEEPPSDQPMSDSFFLAIL